MNRRRKELDPLPPYAQIVRCGQTETELASDGEGVGEGGEGDSLTLEPSQILSASPYNIN